MARVGADHLHAAHVDPDRRARCGWPSRPRSTTGGTSRCTSAARGLTTSPIPYRRRQFQVDFDFLDHRLEVSDSEGGSFAMPLGPSRLPGSTASSWAGCESSGSRSGSRRCRSRSPTRSPSTSTSSTLPTIRARPSRSGAGCSRRTGCMKAFQTGFVGKASPVHFFWGSFDLATTRFSGRRGAAPSRRRAQLSDLGHGGGLFPRGDQRRLVALERGARSARSTPTPTPSPWGSGPRRSARRRQPSTAASASSSCPTTRCDARDDPDAAVQAFLQSTYDAGADLGGWDRAMLEPAIRPDRPPRRPWSTVSR